MAKIKSNSVKKILDRLKTIVGNKEKYAEFYGEYGRLIKEGVYQDFEHKDALTELIRFKSTKDDGLVSLREYVDRMGRSKVHLLYNWAKSGFTKNSPLLEMYQKKDVEVLLLDDEIDEIIISSVPKYDEKDLKSVNQVVPLTIFLKNLIKMLKNLYSLLLKNKKVLGDKVKDVKLSNRLSDSFMYCCR